jgi:hypothetical protein
MYQIALRKSSNAAPFNPARQRYLIALPMQKLKCSVTWMHSTPEAWLV